MEQETTQAKPEILFPEDGVKFNDVMATVELFYIREALRRARNNHALASRLLGLNRTTLVEKMRKYGMPLKRAGRRAPAAAVAAEALE